MVAVNLLKWSSRRKATVQLLLMCVSVGHWIGSAAGADLDEDYSTPFRSKRTTPWILPMTRPAGGFLPKQTTTPVMAGRSTLKPAIPKMTPSLQTTPHSTTILLRPTTSHSDTRPFLTAGPVQPTTSQLSSAASHTTLPAVTGPATTLPPAVLATSPPQLTIALPHPEQSTPAPLTSFTGHPPTNPPPLTQRRSTRAQTAHPPTQHHFTDEPNPTTRKLPPRPTTRPLRPHPTDGRPTEEHHPHHTVKPPPPPETEEPHPPSKPHKPSHPSPTTTQAQPITTQHPQASSYPTTKKGIPVRSENPTTQRKTTVPSTWRPKTHSPHQHTAVQLVLQISWTELCPDMTRFRSSVSKFAGVILNLSNPPDVQLLNDTVHCPPKKRLNSRGTLLNAVQVDFCILSKGTCDSSLTESVGLSMQGDIPQLQTYLEPKVLSVHVYKPIKATSYLNKNNKPQVGIATGLSVTTLLAVMIGTVLAYRVYRSRLAKRRALHNRYYFDGKILHDTLNESHQLSPRHTISSMPATLHQLMPAINEGLVMDDEEIGVAKMYPSHVLSMHSLSQFYSYVEAIVEEYETLVDCQNSAMNKSQSSPKHFITLPGQSHSQGHHGHSNAGSLFHPPPKTRITLEKVSPSNQNGFLNANLVMGYGNGSYSYIATAAPWGTSLADFWEMVWEQQSRTLICLCSPEEMGMVCPWYWPREEGIQAAQLYGDILVMRQGCVLTENYCMSSLLVKNIQKNLCRPITHFWFTQWPAADVPASTAVMISFLLHVRQTVQESYGPVVAHCSDGCGRTGTLLAIDSGMRSLEDLCTVDVPSIVCSIRHDRGAAVLQRDHYAFIYKALYEYSVMLTRGLTGNIDADVSLC